MEDEDREIVDDLFLLCRLCIVHNGKFAIVPGTQIHNSIHEIYGVQIEPYDGLSQLLCISCKKKLIEILNLRATYITNQEILAALRNSHSKQSAHTDVGKEIKKEPEDTPLEDSVHEDIGDISPSPKSTESIPEIQAALQTSTVSRLPLSHVECLATDTCHDDSSNYSSGGDVDNKNLIDAHLLDYEYHCRMCSDRFDSVFILKQHAKSHSNLIRIQRRYTPYTCSVRLPRVMLDEDSEPIIVDIREQRHPLFYIKRKTNEKPISMVSHAFEETEKDCSDDCLSGNDMDFEPSDDDMDVATYSDKDGNIETVDKGESGSERGNKCENKLSLSIFEQTSSYNSIPANTDDLSVILRDYPSNFGAILREVNSVLDEDVEAKCDLVSAIPKDHIHHILEERIKRFCVREEEAGIERIQLLLLHLCKQKIKVTWKEVKTNTEIVIKYRPLNESKKLSIADGFQVIKHHNVVAKKSTTFAHETLTNSKVKSHGHSQQMPSSVENGADQKKVDIVKSHNKVAKKRTALAHVNTPTTTNLAVVGQILPVIISTTTVEASSEVVDSTSVYIDLEDGQNTITSDQFPQPLTPTEFFQHILEQEKHYISFAKPSLQAIPLACFKKNVENRGDLIVSISKDDNILYIEVCEGKVNIDLTQENEFTQWTVLSSLTQAKIENLMKNHAKRNSINLNSVEMFIKIMRSISGSVTDTNVRLQAPKKFFF